MSFDKRWSVWIIDGKGEQLTASHLCRNQAVKMADHLNEIEKGAARPVKFEAREVKG